MVLIVLSIYLMILMTMEFTKEILPWVKMSYKENKQMSKSVFIRQKFWGEIWYMSTLLAITFDRNIVLMQGLRHWKLDFKSFPTVYYTSDSNNRARNGERLKFAEAVSPNRRLGFRSLEVAAESAFSFCFFRAFCFRYFNYDSFYFIFYFELT